MNPYNGFSGKYRLEVWEMQKVLNRAGVISWQDKPCDICGQTGGLIMPHCEDYSKVLEFYPLCVECHMKLHARFTNPVDWFMHLARVKAGYKPYPWKSVYAYFQSQKRTRPVEYEEADYPEGDRWFHKLLLIPVDLCKGKPLPDLNKIITNLKKKEF